MFVDVKLPIFPFVNQKEVMDYNENNRDISNFSRYKSQDFQNDLSVDLESGRKVDMIQERKTISTWTRDVLEDKYLRLQEDFLTLKKYARQQETKIKKMSTKLIRLTDDTKKNGGPTPSTKGDDIEMLQRKLSTLDSQNVFLKEKVRLLTSQLTTPTKKNTVYDGVTSRINSGVPKQQNVKNNVRMIQPRGESLVLSPSKDRDDSSVNRQLSAENIRLTQMLEELKGNMLQINRNKQDAMIRQSINRSDSYDGLQKGDIESNLELIRLRKEIKEKEMKINLLEARYDELMLKQDKLQSSNSEMARDIERLTNQFTSNAQFNDKSGDNITHVLRKRVSELEMQITEQKNEIRLLKDTNEKLTDSAFNTDRERKWKEKEIVYQTQVSQLQATLKRDVVEKGGVLDSLGSERNRTEQAEKELSNLRLKNYEMQALIDELNRKLQLLTKEGNVDMNDLEEALLLIRSKKNKNLNITPELSFIEKVDSRKDQDVVRKLQDEEMKHAETIQELEKTRSLLRTQYKIANDYKQEADRISKRLEELQRDYDTKLTEYSRLLDIRAARIHKLEAQLKDVAYGTRNTQISTGIEPTEDESAAVVLERGENILEVHIGQVCLTQEAIDKLVDSDPLLFGTWDFYDFETQATGVLRGTTPDFDITAEYIVKIDDFFLSYLSKSTFTFELHQAVGTEYVTLANCQLTCRDIMDRPADEGWKRTGSTGFTYSCRAKLIGSRPDLMEISFGIVDYWVRLKYPMDQVMRQYREKLKAEGYLLGNQRASEESKRPIENMNELVIRVLRCTKLQSRQKHVQPSPFFLYKFYDYPHHTSVTIPSSNNPEFHDIKRLPVQMDNNLHQYLKSQSIQIFVLDDLDSDPSSCLGIAKIPLITLCHNKKIIGSFELYDNANQENGTIDVEIEWLHSYLYQDPSMVSETNGIPLLPGEEMLKSDTEPQVTPLKEEKPKEVVKGIMKNKKSENLDVKSKTIEAKQPVIDQMDTNLSKKIESGFLSPPTVQNIRPAPRKREMTKSDKQPVAELLKDTSIVNLLSMDDNNNVKHSGVRQVSPANSVSEEEISREPSLNRSDDVRKSIEDAIKKLEMLSPAGDVSEESSSKNPPQKVPRAKQNELIKSPRDAKSVPGFPNTNSQSQKPNEKSTNVVAGNDDVMIEKSARKSRPRSSHNKDEIMVEIVSVEFNENAFVLKDDSITNLFVAYRLPGIKSEESETECLPKPSSSQLNKKMTYNCRKTFDVSFANNHLVRRHIATMLTEESKEIIEFTLVSEPNDENEECEDVAVAKVNVKTILKQKKDIENEKIPLVRKDNPKETIGTIEATIKIFGVLKAIQTELQS